ncbi:MAG TPA: non-ribosomal peptide synthase/polyketide synthase [Longimicrobiaceae bacterium]|jgi:amino acid adenylation domain-containing protein
MAQPNQHADPVFLLVEDVYPLTPVQAGMLFHALYDPGSRLYANQYVFRLRGTPDAEALRRAWQGAVDRHPVLRTSFAWEGLDRPLQVVRRGAELPWEEHDWHGLPDDERRARRESYLEADRARDFDLGRAPLMRVALLRTAGDGWELVWSFHHLLIDGWSMGLVLRDVFALYEAELAGSRPALPRSRPYRDYVAWLLRQDLAAAEAFWRRSLKGFTAATPPGTARAAASGTGEAASFSRVSRLLSPAATEALTAFARARRLTPNTIWQGAWGVLLSRWSGEEDVVFGATVSGREAGLAGMDEMVGLFINTLPVRLELRGGETVGDALARLQAGQAEARGFHYSPLPEVQRWSEVPAGSPLFESLVVFENHPVWDRVGGGEGGFRVEGWDRMGGSHYALTLSVLPGERASLRVEYDRLRIDADAAERMTGNLLVLLEAMAAGPGRRLAELPLLGAAERAQVVEEWNRTALPFPEGACIHDLFAARAARAPEAPALSWGGEELTYRELDRRADRLARRLAGLGVGPEERVGVLLERGPEMVLATLAVLKAGGCCVPVDTGYPPERMRLMLEDSAARVLLTQESLRDRLPDFAGETVALDAPLQHDDAGDASAVAVAGCSLFPVPCSLSLAYVFYTSGSTGRPKGVMMSHREVVQFAAGVPETMPMGPGDRVAQASNASFDAALFETWGALLAGATLVGIDRDVLLSAPALARTLRDRRITHLYQTAALFHQHVRERADVYAGLKQLVFGAEAVGTEGVRRMLREGRPGRVLHEYGPTEATVWCTLDVVEELAEDAATVPIGRPVPNARTYVLDRELEPAPVGVPGELYVGGAGVVRGYLGRPELTAERFVPDPFGGGAGARLYRTGDRVRWLADGRLEFLGRLDEQVKLRGFRVEPAEVEAALAACPGVRQARVVVREDEPGDKRLVAYVVGDAEPDALRARLRASLPEYLVPSALVALDALPLTPNGKLDRRALPAPEVGAGRGYVAPRTAAEEALAGIWASVLGAERVGAEDGFFELGGHSLLAMQVVSRVRKELGVEVPLRALFEAPTVAALAERVEALRGAGAAAAPQVEKAASAFPADDAAEPAGGALEAPLSFAQQRLWLVDRLEPGSAAYNMPYALRLRGALDADALQASLDAMVRRHETLRTVFADGDDGPVQLIHPAADARLVVLDLEALPEAEREAAAERLADEEALRPFDLARGPLLRGTLLRLGPEYHVLLFTLHHIVSDGWSMEVLVDEVSALYAALSRGEEPELPELEVQYADFAIWQREQLRDETLEEELAWWRGQLAGAPPLLEVPTDRPRAAGQSPRAARHEFTLAPETAAGLRALSRQQGATLFMTLLAGWQALLSSYSGQDDVVVGTPVAGRTQRELEGLIGFFVNMLCMRADLSGDPSGAELLARVRETALGAYAHQDLPFERLVEELAPERSLAHTPLFQASFALNRTTAERRLRLGDVAMEAFGEGDAVAKFDLYLMATDRGEELDGVLVYREALFDAATVERMGGHLETLLAALAAGPGRRLSELSLLRPDERAQLLAESRADAAGAAACVHELFAAQAAATPHLPAVSGPGGALSYAELERAAGRLAGHLRRRGVGPETRVAVCLEPGVELVAAVLAVFRAGGAYVPLDPAYPSERLAYTLADSGASVLLTRSALLDALPAFAGETVRLDADAEAIAGEPDAAPASGVGPRNAAYVIYTSGSTGRPKGVVVEHAAVANTLLGTRAAFAPAPGDVMAALAGSAFDIWLFEVFAPLLSGGEARLVERDAVRDVERLVAELAGVDALHAVPALMREIAQRVQAGPGTLPRVKRVFVGGDAVPPDLIGQMRRAFPSAEAWVLYGPTEAAIVGGAARLRAEGGYAWQVLGRPLPGAALYVCDPWGGPLPAGVAGELWMGGAGVARGYLGRPELTAERFVPDALGGEPGARLYRTGDRVRRRADGELEFLGRTDAQVKIRGFRIEPGEIEAALLAHPAVREAAVAVREDAPGQKRLVAYVAPEEESGVELWPSIGEYFVYDELIYRGLTRDDRRNARYLRALEHAAPGKVVLDVGTGMDAILARLAVQAGARHVYAVEILERSYLAARDRIRELGLEDRVTLIHGDALTVELPEPADVVVSEIVEAIAGGEGAAAILNGVRRLLAPGAVMIPGMTRTCMAAVTLPDEVRRAPAFSPTAAHYVRRIWEQVGHPFDLRLCIRGFPADARLSNAGVFEELDFGAEGPVAPEYRRAEELEIRRAGRLDGLLLWLRMELAEGGTLDIVEEETAWFPVYFPLFEPGVEVRPGDRLRVECRAELPDGGVAPDYAARGSLVRGDGTEVPFDFVSAHHAPSFRASPFYRRLFAGDGVPVREGRGEELAASLRAHLAARLPEHMVPSAFVALDRLPLGATGKLDRRALPAPEREAGAYVAPRTATEEALAGIWAQVLGRGRVGVEDGFIELGGHSLLATQVVSRTRQAFGVEVPLRALFEAGTVARLAERVDALRGDAATLAPPIVRTPRDAPPPLSFAQQRLWLTDRLEPGSAAYNMPFALRLRGALDAGALRMALDELARRHEALRTTFAERDGAAVQVIHPPAPVALAERDLRGLPAAEREAEAERIAAEEALLPFDLEAGPLLRSTLLRLDDEDHVLCFTLHHVVGDGWSVQVLTREVSALYAALSRREAPGLPELAIQYADFAVWQRGWLRGETLEAQLAWWRERLAGAPPLLEVPVDHPRVPGQSPAAASHALALPVEVSRGLRELSEREGATLFMTVLAAWQALLGRYSGQDDVVVGSPVAGRNRRETEGLIGFFVNMLALRADLSGDPAWTELLGRVRDGALGAFDHQDLPFERLVEDLGVERSLTHSPVFQATFALHRAAGPDDRLRLGDVAAEPFGGGERVAKFDLDLVFTEAGGSLAGTLVYRAALWEPATTARLAGHLETLLEAMAADPRRRLSETPLLRGAERAQVLEAWNATAAAYPRDLCVHDLFAMQAARAPDSVALVHGGERVTYAELDHRSARLADVLRVRGVGPEVRVGVCMARTPELVVSLLAVLRAGGAYVPMDPGYPVERLRHMLSDSGAALLLADAAAAERLADCGVEVLVDAASDRSASAGEPSLSHSRTPALSHSQSLAYVVYTSGSTGTPKGVLGTHRAAVNRFAWMWSAYPFAADEVCVQKTSLAFVDSVWEVFGPLLAGVPSVLVPDEDARDPRALAAALSRHGVTRVVLVPSLLRALLDSDVDLRETCPRLRLVVTSGEALPAGLARRFAEAVPGATLLNLYGSSEVAADSTHHALRAADAAGERVPIGQPIWNTRVYVVDAALEPVPTGAAGELYVAGDGLARGYMGNAAATAERFLPEPFGGADGARMYRTGDRARWTAAGELEYLGRADAQVKVRGFRVELGEVEAALRAHPAVREAVAVVREDAAGDGRIAAYVVADVGEAVAPAELRAHVGARLPEHMVPGAFVMLETLPLTPSGKLDRRALPAPRWGAEGAYVAPRTATEEVLAGVWAEVLGVERVGVAENFFALGGHSLLATQVASRVRQALGVELPLRALFEAPTVGGLSERIEALRSTGGPAAPPIARVPRDEPLPLSFAQQRLWVVDRIEPGSAAYNMAFALRLRGAPDVAALRGSLDALVRRHEALRTTFAARDGRPVQTIHPPAPVPLPVLDLGLLSGSAREAEAERRVAEEALRPFDLETGPLLRSALLRLDDADHVLCFTLHHVVSDGWSMQVLTREVSALYPALLRGEEPTLPELPVQYADYAVWQREWLRGDALDAQTAFWRERLAGAPPLLEIPTDRPRALGLSPEAASHPLVFTPEVSRGLRELSRRAGTTLFMTVLAGWQALLARYAGQDDVVVGTPVAGRTRRETEGLIGFFVNMLALRADLSGDPAWAELLGRVREAALGAYDHQELPFERLVEELGVERSLTHSPVFQATFALRRAAGDDGLLRLGDVELESFGGGDRVARFDLDLSLADSGDALGGALVYRAALWDAATMERMAAHLEAVLEAMAADPRRRLSELSLLRGAERAQLLEAWSDGGAAVVDEELVHERFARQARRTPDAVAVRAGGRTLTYAELDRDSDMLAGRLLELGVGPDVRVGICLERGPEMVAAVLGVLRAGGAYVPLDPSHPAERLARMLEDAAPAVLLTRRSLAGRLPTDGVRTVLLDADEDALSHSHTPALSHSPSLDNLAYVVFTSGSTGRPKGVAVTHRGLAAYLAWAADAYAAPGHGAPVHSSLSFDLTVTSLLSPLLRGERVVLVDESEGVEGLARALREEPGFTLVKLTPAHLALLARQLTPAEAAAAARTLVVGGEALPAELAAHWRRVAPGTEIVNEYGPTETVVGCVVHRVRDGSAGAGGVPIGRPIAGARAYVLDAAGEPVPVGVPGELYVGGAGVARGYLAQPAQTAERFVPDPFGREPGARLYRTGDRARWLPAGELDYLGRTDAQVKVRGYRIEPGEVETVLAALPGVREAVVVAREDAPGDRRLVAYVVPEAGSGTAAYDVGAELRAGLRERLPEYMVPAAFVVLDAIPLTPNGKADRRALPAPSWTGGAGRSRAPLTATERAVAAIWEEALGVPRVGVADNFFDLGGHSLLLVQVHARLQALFPDRVALIDLFEHHTLGALAARLDRGAAPEARAEPGRARVRAANPEKGRSGREIAVVGMAGRFPGARDLDEFWSNLRAGVRSIRRFSDEELKAAGVSRRDREAPGYVPAAGVLDGAEMFDAAFFGITPREATVMNPQQRVFLECAWEALERAGYAAGGRAGRVGVWAAEGQNRYLLDVLSRPELVRAVGSTQVMLANSASVATLASYKLDLEGPSMNVQTMCSSSLVAVHLACKSLLDGESDVALAGGVRIELPQIRGYQHQPGGIMSPTGECSPFDAEARGTVAGSGAGVVVLRRLDDALADGDTVLAVIRGTAVNNDGGRRVGFTTPRREGQAAAIADALAAAGVAPAEVSYVEAHGSGTEVGDPIEVAALASAFGEGKPGSCALGAVKSSIGHLDAAAGVVGLIKTVLALQHGEIPPAPYFSRANPRIDFERSPFYVTPELRPWTRDGAPRRAGVSSFGLGGTNAHLVLEEAPEPAPSGPSRPWQLLVLSARTPAALEAATDRLAGHLRAHPDEPIADVAHTLRAGRRRFERRRVLVCRGREDAVAALESRDARRLLEAAQERDERPVAFLFPGVGDHYAGMARGLYDAEPVFRAETDRCAALLRAHTGADVRGVLFPDEPPSAEDEGGAARIDLRGMLGRGESAGDDPLGRTELAHPAVFVVEYALARLWMSWGVKPDAMIGHSLGEYAAATVAGVFALEDALALLAERARLIAALPAGAMLAVPLDPAALRPRLRGALALAAHNAPGLCTVSGPADAVAALEAELRAEGMACRRLVAEHAFHSAQMQPVAAALAERLRTMRLSAPEVPFVSGVTGTWIRPEEATDPEYWARHLCGTVRFAEGMGELLADPRRVLLEVGPGRTLGTFAVHAGAAEGATFASLRHAYTRQADQAFLLETLGRLWMAGVRVDWDGFVAGESRRRVPLPTYPFERQPYLVEPRRRRRRRPRGEARASRPAPGDGPTSAPEEGPAGEPSALHPRPETGTRYVAPSGELEERIAALWQDLLGFERIGAHDDFFSLGGHSLTATHLVARIQAELGADVSLHAVFEAPTVAGLAARVAELRAGDAARVEPIRRVPRDGPLPLSFAQQRLWVVDRLDPGNPAYNMPYVLRLRGVPDVRVLRGSLDALVARHETLRTTFVEGGGEPMQTVHAPSPVALPTVDLGGLPDPAREARRLVGEEALRPFDLVRGPLLRCTLLRLADDDHVLCYTMHHIVSDGWSKGVIVREISAIYTALARGEAPALPELPVQYADYAVWQREWLSGPELEAQLGWWRDRLAGAPPLLEIPTDHPRAIGQSVLARMHALSIPEATSHGLQALSRREGTTLFMTLLAAWEVLLGRWSGQEDLVVGGPISGRTRWETEGLIGFFVNMLPHRADLRGDPTWSELLARVREASRGAYAHQELPFERLVEELVTERSLTHNPLFQVAFTLERSDGKSVLSLGDLGVESFGGEESASKFDLDVAFVEQGEQVVGALTYRTGLFEAATAARMAGHLEALLEAMTADPGARLSETSLLRGAERARVLEAWNDTAADLPREPVHERFAAQAARTPGAPAVHAGGETVTYGELERRARVLARRLRALGVGPETRVGLLAERGIPWVAAVLAIFKAGGVYVPMEPAYPAERLAFMLSDSGAAVLLAPAPLQEAVAEFAGERVRLDAEWEGDDAPLEGGAWPDNAAWVIYTSGSTGRPKGVVATHAGAANLLAHGVEVMGVGPGSRVLQTASATFDASLLDMFAALLSGAELHVADRETVLSPERLAALLREREIDTWVCTPALPDTLPDTDFPALRTLCVGGDRCSAGTAARWSRGRRMLNMYGPTEITIYTTEHRVTPGAAGAPPVGRPVPNARAYVLDASGGPTPPGVPGELHIGGAGVARGYLGLPALTAEKFVPDPFGGEPGARLYRTGDRVRWRADGELEFLGRTDAQVKIRGFRIEPGEIETVLREQPGVREAVVLVREDAPGRQRLVAYFVGAGGEAPTAAGLRARLGARLPEYMVPAAFVALERIPLNSSGKLDRAALPAPRWSSEGAYVAPRTPTERLLCGILAEVLGVERVGVEDGFFELGGHSLMATQVVSRVREAAGVEVPLRALFETPTVAALAARVDELQGAGAAFARPIERVARARAGSRR